MKVKWFSKYSQLDEMQELTLRRIEGRAFWLVWAGLLIDIAVQSALGTIDKNMIGELLIFLIGSIYAVGASVRSGIWDRHFKASFTVNLLGLLVAGAVVGGTQYIRNSYWLGTLLAGGFTFLLTLFVLQTTMHFYEKRHQELEHPKEEDDESED